MKIKIKKTGEIVEAIKTIGLDGEDYFQRVGGKLWFHKSEIREVSND